MTHAFADAALDLKARHGLRVEDIERIVAYVHTQEIPVICEPAVHRQRPQNAYDAQFSINYVIAAALIRDRFGLAELESDALNDADILELCAKTSYCTDPDSAYPDYYSGALDIHMRDGRCLHRREQMNRGSAENPMSEDDITGKFIDNATRTLSPAGAQAVMDCVLDLENASDLETLMRYLSDVTTA
jgi:2-methylcitrate dehydratase PrpD